MENLKEYYPYLEEYGLPLLWAIVIFVVGKFVAKLIAKLISRMLTKSNVDSTVVTFVSNISYVALLTFVIVAALEKVGVNTTSFAAILAAAGLAVGLALQGSLSNFASGVLLIIFRPFKMGDYVDIAGTSGTVEEIQIFTTKLKSPDNKEIIVPNGQITSSTIVNYSTKPTRRVDLVVCVGYDDDLKKVRSVLQDILESDERILKDPEYTIGLLEMADSSINFAVRPWTKSENYWPLFFDLQEKIKLRFDEEKISIPYPQTDVHIHNKG